MTYLVLAAAFAAGLALGALAYRQLLRHQLQSIGIVYVGRQPTAEEQADLQRQLDEAPRGHPMILTNVPLTPDEEARRRVEARNADLKAKALALHRKLDGQPGSTRRRYGVEL